MYLYYIFNVSVLITTRPKSSLSKLRYWINRRKDISQQFKNTAKDGIQHMNMSGDVLDFILLNDVLHVYATFIAESY
jgi:hypothetical protein